MSGPSNVEPVVSGSPYRVVAVNDHVPTGLHDVLQSVQLVMEVELHGHCVVVQGTVRTGDNQRLMVYEKSEAGEGKDIRVWSVQRRNEHFEATPRPSG